MSLVENAAIFSYTKKGKNQYAKTMAKSAFESFKAKLSAKEVLSNIMKIILKCRRRMRFANPPVII